MTRRTSDLLITGIAPCIWGSTYAVTTQALDGFSPLTVALLRALPAGLLLLAVARQLPTGVWWWRVAVLGGLNFSLFLGLLFVAAYRLPGGVAATVSSVQPLFVVLLARIVLDRPIQSRALAAAGAGAVGVALMVVTPAAALDAWGLLAGLGAAASMAAGTVLSRRWQPDVSPLTFTAWQLTAGGILLIPAVIAWAPPQPPVTAVHATALAWLGLVGMAGTSVLWFRGLRRLESTAVSLLLLLSPLTAIVIGWLFLGESLGLAQCAGAAVIAASIWAGQASAGALAKPVPAGGPPSRESARSG